MEGRDGELMSDYDGPHNLWGGQVEVPGERLLTDADFKRLADEAEKGYDVSKQEPTKPEVWVKRSGPH